jgi:hypothetical protein
MLLLKREIPKQVGRRRSPKLHSQEKTMKTATMDEHRLAARINLVDEHVRAENNHDLDGTMATLNETPLFKLNDEEIAGHDGVRGFLLTYSGAFPTFTLM